MAQTPVPPPAARPVALDPVSHDSPDSPEALSAALPEPPPKPAHARRRASSAPPVPVPSEADYLAEQEAWRAYQSSAARAWKSYQARTITREAYDAEVKRAWVDYQAVATGGNAASTLGRKGSVLDLDIKPRIQIQIC